MHSSSKKKFKRNRFQYVLHHDPQKTHVMLGWLSPFFCFWYRYGKNIWFSKFTRAPSKGGRRLVKRFHERRSQAYELNVFCKDLKIKNVRNSTSPSH